MRRLRTLCIIDDERERVFLLGLVFFFRGILTRMVVIDFSLVLFFVCLFVVATALVVVVEFSEFVLFYLCYVFSFIYSTVIFCMCVCVRDCVSVEMGLVTCGITFFFVI